MSSKQDKVRALELRIAREKERVASVEVRANHLLSHATYIRERRIAPMEAQLRKLKEG